MATAVVAGWLVIGGQDRPYRVGQAQEAPLRGLHHRKGADGLPFSAKAYREAFGPDALRAALPTGHDLRDFVYAALAAGYAAHRLRVDFTHVQVGTWLAAAPGVAAPLLAAAVAALPVVLRPAVKIKKKTSSKPVK